MLFNERKYTRAIFHDYNGGLYFVTVCTKDKRHYLGRIDGGEMCLSELGLTLKKNIDSIEQHYSDVEIPLFTIMPNHFHAIIFIDGRSGSNAPVNAGRLNQLCRIAVAMDDDPAEIAHHNCRLGNVVAGIKAHVTRYARVHNIEFGWQNRFFDHIIRGDYDCNRISQYIENNVANWATDRFFC